MAEKLKDPASQIRSAHILAMINVFVWALAIIAMVFLMQDSPVVKRLFPILAGGVAVGGAQISALSKMK